MSSGIYLYTPKQLEPWKEKIDRLAQKAEKTFAVTNNHYKGKAAVNALELKQMLSAFAQGRVSGEGRISGSVPLRSSTASRC